MEAFDRIVLLNKTNGEWGVTEIHSSADYQESFMPPLQNERFIKDILQATHGLSNMKEMFLLTNYPGREDFNTSIEPYVVASPLIFGRILSKDNPEAGVLVGVTHSGKILNQDWMSDNASLAHVVLRSGVDNQCLFLMKRDSAAVMTAQ